MATILEFRPRESAVSKIGDVADAAASDASERRVDEAGAGRRSPTETDGTTCDILLFTGVRYSREMPDMPYAAHADAIDGMNAGA